jgi:hypothetical protein
MFNIFHYKNVQLLTQRKFTESHTIQIFEDIKLFCKKYKLTFADLISQVLFNNIEYELFGNKALIGQEEYDLINDGDLGELNAINQVEWTTENLKSTLLKLLLHTIYFTRQPTEPYLTQWTSLINHNYGRTVIFKNIYTIWTRFKRATKNKLFNSSLAI